ncbi:MAG: N-acetyltransferase, partial [Bacteroidetes bacterium]
SAELWYWLGQAYWGRGIVSAALKAMIDYAFTQFVVTRLYAQPMAHNVASIKVLEKAGFRREGLLRDSVVKNNVLMDTVLYAYLSSDWLADKNERI